MPKYTYRNVSNTRLHAFLAFSSISKHFHHTNCSPGPVDLVPSRWTNLKVSCFYTAPGPHSVAV